LCVCVCVCVCVFVLGHIHSTYSIHSSARCSQRASEREIVIVSEHVDTYIVARGHTSSSMQTHIKHTQLYLLLSEHADTYIAG
jgi:hypothetical protein